jgi:phytoene synthase
MIFTTAETLSYYTSLVRTQRRDWFLAAMFLPIAVREAVIAIYSLDIELEHVHHMVKEEMIGHIRYAWWFESVEGLSGAAPVRDHPLFQAITNANISSEILLSLVTAYRESFPEMPIEIDETVQNVVKKYLDSNLQSKKWKKASSVIAKHRKKYGLRRDGWLLIKLLFI